MIQNDNNRLKRYMRMECCMAMYDTGLRVGWVEAKKNTMESSRKMVLILRSKGILNCIDSTNNVSIKLDVTSCPISQTFLHSFQVKDFKTWMQLSG